jgi:hypothetical protein
VALAFHHASKEAAMKCQFCHQDVDDPCHNAQQMQQRAMSHVERCEHALQAQQDMGSGAHRRDVQGNG